MSTFAVNTFPVLPVILTDPVTPSDPVIWVDPLIVVFELTLNPYAGSVDAVTEPDPINDRLRPTTAEADILVSPPPLPKKEPVNDPVKGPFPDKANDDVTALDADTAFELDTAKEELNE